MSHAVKPKTPVAKKPFSTAVYDLVDNGSDSVHLLRDALKPIFNEGAGAMASEAESFSKYGGFTLKRFGKYRDGGATFDGNSAYPLERYRHNRHAYTTLCALNGGDTYTSAEVVELLNYDKPTMKVGEETLPLGGIALISDFVKTYRDELIEKAKELAREEGGAAKVHAVEKEITQSARPSR